MGKSLQLPRVLVSNDDGIQAPGLKALVAQIANNACCSVHVCAPSGERSAQSHAITLGRHLACHPSEVDGAEVAFAVDGTPADSVMLALHSPVFQDPVFDLVISGINRGDNCGLHVIYSGTVGAAREAACKGVAAIAFSMDGYKGTKVDDYASSAALAVPLVKGMLGLYPEFPAIPAALQGIVLNVNFPFLPLSEITGYHLTYQGTSCVFPSFKELQEPPGTHLEEVEERTPPVRMFRNFAGEVIQDDSEGSDTWAVKRGWVSVSAICLQQNIPAAAGVNGEGNGSRVLEVTSLLLQAAAANAGVKAAGLVLPPPAVAGAAV